jgi:hypothetical protein
LKIFQDEPRISQKGKSRILNDNLVDADSNGINAFLPKQRPEKKQTLPDKAKGKIRETLR